MPREPQAEMALLVGAKELVLPVHTAAVLEKELRLGLQAVQGLPARERRESRKETSPPLCGSRR